MSTLLLLWRTDVGTRSDRVSTSNINSASHLTVSISWCSCHQVLLDSRCGSLLCDSFQGRDFTTLPSLHSGCHAAVWSRCTNHGDLFKCINSVKWPLNILIPLVVRINYIFKVLVVLNSFTGEFYSSQCVAVHFQIKQSGSVCICP